jgi:hypothetical protein|tara:strand:+ start:22346 stop:22687 length:342 start_codon:yes stop_codon:yes gene_type:complete
MLLKPFWPVVDYVVNYDYIVNFICENRDKPELQCNGTCYLTKELAEEASDADANPLSNNQIKYEWSQVVYVEPISDFNLNGIELLSVKTIPVGLDQRVDSKLYSFNIPKPPQV